MESSDRRIARAYSANNPPYYLLRAFTSRVRSGYQIEVNGSSEMFNLPTIVVENKIDAEAIPPALHTYYEGMTTCQGVPGVMMPDICCDCRGASCARNPACLCKQHQASYGSDVGLKGFIYTKEGQLQNYTGIPIFECHEGCLCNDKCRNHVSSCLSHCQSSDTWLQVVQL